MAAPAVAAQMHIVNDDGRFFVVFAEIVMINGGNLNLLRPVGT